jgi:hypothetical protein
MKALRGPVAALLVLSAVAALRLSAADQSLKGRIGDEIRRVEGAWSQIPTADATVKSLGPVLQASLKAATEAQQAGRLYLALEKLAQAQGLLEGARAIVEKTAAVKSGMPAFEAEWQKANARVADLSREIRSKQPAGAPAGLRALSETSLGRSVPLLDGSRGFATATGPGDGLFYLGEAIGEAEFAQFCASLQEARKSRGWSARSMLAELVALQAKADAAFQPPQSIQQHQRFIALNSTLKLARELDSSKSYYGALYQYLEAVRHYAMLDAPAVDGNQQARLKASIEAESAKPASSAADDSIRQLFLERAASQASHADGSEPSADEWRSAQVIVSRVLPAYAAAWKAPAALTKSGGKTIDVTLVRWPYT